MGASGSVYEAISQIKEIKRAALDRQRFRGYSGTARALCGTLALLATLLMSAPFFPKNMIDQADAWGALFAVSMIINYGALVRWFFMEPEAKRDVRRLIPAFEAFPPLLVGSALTIAMIISFEPKYLFSVWMCCYGLMNLSHSGSLPQGVRLVGLYYILCGVAFLLIFKVDFYHPLPAGLVFFFGEWWGGILFNLNRHENANIFDMLKIRNRS